MYSSVSCPTCQHKFMVPEGEMGKRQVCPNCQALFVAGKSAVLEASPTMARAAAPPPPAAASGYAKTMLGDTAPSIKYTCPRCQAPLEAAASEAGTKTNCPRCTQRVQVPSPPKPEAPPMPSGLNKTMLAAEETAPPIKYNCPGCKKPLEAPASQAGTKTNCPACGQRLQIPFAPAAGPNRNKTMLARDESAGPAGAVHGGQPTPAAAPTPAAPPAAGFETLLTPRNVGIGAVVLVLLALVVPAVLRGGKSTDTEALAKAQAELERLRTEKQGEIDRQRQAEQETRRQIEEMMNRMRAQEERMRDEQRQLLRTISDQAKKSELETKFADAQKKLEQEQLEAERKQQQALAEANRKLEESKRALEAVQLRQQTIIAQPPVVYHPPYHPRYYWPWW